MKKRTKRKICRFVIILLILIAAGVLVYMYFNNKDSQFELNSDINVEINSEFYNTSLINKNVNNTVKTEKKLIDTSKLGKQTITLTVDDVNHNQKEYSATINVVDTTAPEIKMTSDKIISKVGKKIDLLENVSATDNSKEDITVEVSGDYDINTVGEYKLKYTAKDSSGNTATKDFVLVVEKSEGNESNNNDSGEVIKQEDKKFTTSKGFSGETKNGKTYIDGVLVVNKTYSLPSNYAPGLDSGVQSAAQKMFAAAKLDDPSLNIYIASGFRSYDVQKKLYNNYVNSSGKAQADTFSARPGYSEHQSGLAFDVCQANLPCINSGFDNTAPAKWLAKNAYKYGFILRYPKNKSNETGYKYESWHFRYVGEELATKLYNNGEWLTLEDYFGITSEYAQ